MSQQLIKVTEQAKKSETKKATTKKVSKPKPPKDITLEDVKQWISAIEHFEKLNQFLTRQPNAKDDEFVKELTAEVAQEVNAINFNGADLKAFFTKTSKALKEAK
ncbi:hypothetical protein [Peptoniphilus asaccharolyticus]